MTNKKGGNHFIFGSGCPTPGTGSREVAENISAVTPVEIIPNLPVYDLEIYREFMKSKMDTVEVQTGDEKDAEFNIYSVLKHKVYSCRFIYQFNIYKPTVSVICLVENEKSCILSKYT